MVRGEVLVSCVEKGRWAKQRQGKFPWDPGASFAFRRPLLMQGCRAAAAPTLPKLAVAETESPPPKLIKFE